jgi:hypothetical protein
VTEPSRDDRTAFQLLLVGVIGFVVLLACALALSWALVHRFDATANAPVDGPTYTPTPSVSATPTPSGTPKATASPS